MKARSINIFLVDGEPDGIRMAQVSMSTIQAIAFRRNQLKRVRDEFPEIERPGVYILIGDDGSQGERMQAYIGESESVGSRLAHHNSSGGALAKSFWEDTVVLISKDENLNKSHARYVEACLVRAAGGNARWVLPNSKMPAGDAGRLSMPERASMDEFVDQSRTLVGALGWDLFRELRGNPSDLPDAIIGVSETKFTDAPSFILDGRGYSATMKLGISGEFVVVAGSTIKNKVAKSLPGRLHRLREVLVERGVLEILKDQTVFVCDYSFNSPSAAAAFVAGSSINGRVSWKSECGRSYGEWEADQTLS